MAQQLKTIVTYLASKLPMSHLWSMVEPLNHQTLADDDVIEAFPIRIQLSRKNSSSKLHSNSLWGRLKSLDLQRRHLLCPRKNYNPTPKNKPKSRSKKHVTSSIWIIQVRSLTGEMWSKCCILLLRHWHRRRKRSVRYAWSRRDSWSLQEWPNAAIFSAMPAYSST